MLDGLVDGRDEGVREGSRDGTLDGLEEASWLGIKDGVSEGDSLCSPDGTPDGTQEGVAEGAVVEHPLIIWPVFNEPRVGVSSAAHVKDGASHPAPVKYQCSIGGRPATIVVGI